ncbi:MAG: MmcQ/YjbR family DNA-binding protein [Mycoplasmatota bacterium]|nr:MmcQ/YjbR family DNA-binding protein [Mycoplasmatota bacterium]
MSIETQIFKTSQFIPTKLLNYGFVKRNNYHYEKLIMNNTFRVELEINIAANNEISGKIYDLSFGEEYTSFRLEVARGKFASSVRAIYEQLLLDIKDQCTITKLFISPQANRIAKLIERVYGTIPDFPWDKTPTAGVFRHELSKKWYGLIMNININKLSVGDYEVEILNVKIPKDIITASLKRTGFYPAYHMNKQYWLTIILDETLSDQEIMNYINLSYNLTSH